MRDVPDGIGAKLLVAADELGSGFARASMDEIARRSGVPRATLYYYFAGRDEVVGYVLAAALADLAATLQAVVEGPGTAAERLHALVRCNLAHLVAHRAASELLFANLATAGLIDVTSRIKTGILEPIESMLEEGKADGTIRDLDVALTATALFGAILVVGLQDIYLTGTVDVDDVSARLVPIFLGGLA